MTVVTSCIPPEQYAERLRSIFGPEIIQQVCGGGIYAKYQNDPVGFCTEVLGEKFTPDVVRLLESVRDNTITVAQSANATGKCLCSGERILLADGRLVVIDELCGRFFAVLSYNNGYPKPELAWARDNGVEAVFKITTESGRTVLRTAEHPLFCGDIKKTKTGCIDKISGEWVELKNIKPGMAVAAVDSIQICGNREVSDSHIKLLGYLLGDGGLSNGSVVFTQKDGIVKEEFKTILSEVGCGFQDKDELTIRTTNGKHFLKGSNTAINLVRDWGIYGKTAREKSFPNFVWELPNKQISLLLNRLFACDGWAYSETQKYNHNQIGICLASEKMVRDIEFAMLRLGIFGRVRERSVKYNDLKRFRAWEWAIADGREIIKFGERVGIFGKEDCVEKCVEVAKTRTGRIKKWMFDGLEDGFRWDRVKSVDYIGNKQTFSIETEKDHTFLTTLVEHNSHAAARVAVWWYKVFNESQVWTAAAPPESNLKSILWGEIGSVFNSHPKVFQGDEISSLKIKRSPLDFVQGQTVPSSGTAAEREAKFSGKHRANLLFILDEADAIPDEVYKGIESCMSGGNVRMLLMFNPRAMRGEVYRMIRDGRAAVVRLSAMSHPNVVTGEDVIPGAVMRETTVRRINSWCRPLQEMETPGPDTFELPSFLVGSTAKGHNGVLYKPLVGGDYKITNPAFSYMVLGEYPAQAENQLISQEWTARARSRYDAYVSKFSEKPPAGIAGIMGLDAAELGVDANCACFRYGGYVSPLLTWTGVDMYVTGDRASQEFKTRKILTCNVDATGVGAGVAPHMRRLNCNAHGIKVASKPTETTEQGDFGLMRDQLWWACREWLRLDPGAMLPPDEDLLEELHCPTYENRNGKIKVMDKDTMREVLKRSPDRADALCLTFVVSSEVYGDPYEEPEAIGCDFDSVTGY